MMTRSSLISSAIIVLCGLTWESASPALAAEHLTGAKAEVMSTLEHLAKATVDKDVAALDKLYHKDLIFIHTSSQTEDKAEVLEQAPSRPVAEMKYRDVVAHVYGNAALVNVNMDLKLVTSGKTLDMVDNTTFVLIKESGRWQVVSRQTTKGAKTKTEMKAN